ncbi:TraR/DksA C4-type zinc finger protein [Neisseriaceae bacterium B1]
MSRQIDKACEEEERHRAAALAHFQAAQNRAAVSAYECEECGDPIPEARRQAVIGCRCCIECQQWLENHAKA